MEVMTPSDMLRGLWFRARWQLQWAHCRNSSPSPWQPSLMEKHDSSPLIQTPLCHSEVNRQIIHQWDSIPIPSWLPPPLPPSLHRQRQQSEMWLVGRWGGVGGVFEAADTLYIDFTLIFSFTDSQVFKYLTFMIRNSLHMENMTQLDQVLLT